MIDYYTELFTKKPDDMSGVSVVVCTHAVHGVYQFYLSMHDFQSEIKNIIIKAWVNGFVIVVYPATI